MFRKKGNPFFSVHESMPGFNVGREAVVQIPCFVPLVCRIRDVVVGMIKIVFLTSSQLIFTFDKLSNVLF